MFKCIKNKKGDIATPILTILGVFTIVAFLVLTFEKIAPAATYMKANQVARKYSLIMENEGGLSKQKKAALLDELRARNIEIDQDGIDATESASYGEEVNLKIAFEYTTTEITVSGFQVSREKKNIPMRIVRSTISRSHNED